MKKRVLSLFLAVMMLLLLVMPGVSAATYEDSLHVITSLGYVEENAEDHPITRGEASEMLVKLMELGYTADAETPLPFGDVPATHPYYQAIASGLQLGMVSSDTEFRPDDVITYAEMAKMIVCLLGHAEPALDLGGYPAGFALMAQRLGINEGVSGVTDAQLSSHEATIMLYNTFCANVKEPVRFTAADGGVFYNETHKLYQYLGYELAEGIVVANDLTSLNSADELDEGTVAITSMDQIYRVGETDIDAYLGYKVRAFYKEQASGYKEIKTFYTAPETKVLTLGYEDTPFAYLEGERILIDYYKDNGKLTNIVTSAKTVVVNGVCSSTVTNESLDAMFGDFKGGTLTLIGNTTGSGYDVVKVDKPISGLVTRVDATNCKIYYKDYAIPGHEMEVILDEDTDLKVYTPDGKLTELANITPGVVISVYASENKKYARIYTSTTVVEGTLTVINPDGKYYIDGKAYEKLETIPDSVMKLGVKSRFYLNKEGFIAGLDTDNVNYSYYGLLMNASTNGGEYIQVLTSAGELKTLECEERIYAFDGTAVTKVDFSTLICYTEVDKGYGNVPKHMLWYTRNAKNFTYDTNNYSSTDTQFYWRPGLSEQDKSNAASRKPIYYELNDKGKVRKIIVPDIGGEDNKISSMNVIDGTNHTFWAPRSANLSISNSTSATTYRVSSNAIAYSCLARTYDAEDYKYAGAYSYFTDGKSRKFQLYSLEDSGKVDIMVGYDFLPYRACKMFIKLAEKLGKTEDAELFRSYGAHMRDLVDQYGWDSEGYYIYGIDDWGDKIGGHESQEGKIHLNPQLWAVLSGISKDGKELIAFEKGEKELRAELGCIGLKPAYTEKSHHLGSIAEKAPGVQENGGVYLHTIAWKIAVDGMLKRRDLIEKDICTMLPFRNPVVAGRGEPYMLFNSYCAEETGYRCGTPGQSWRTASGQWFLKAIINYVFGLMPTIEGLTVDPCLPESWKKCSITKRFRKAVYNIAYIADEQKGIEVDGTEIEGNLLPYEDGKTFEVVVKF